MRCPALIDERSFGSNAVTMKMDKEQETLHSSEFFLLYLISYMGFLLLLHLKSAAYEPGEENA